MSCDFEEDRRCLFIKGFPANFSVILPEVRSFFEERVGKCSLEMKEVSKDKRFLYIVVGFDSPGVAADVLERFDGKHVLGHKVKMSYWRVRTETAMKERQQKSLCHDIDIDARNRSSRGCVEDDEVYTRCTVNYTRDQGSWNEGSRESTHCAKQADSFNRPPRCEELTWADTRYHAPDDYPLQFKSEEEWYKEGQEEQYTSYHVFRNGRDVNPGGRKESYDVAESHHLGIRRQDSYYQDDTWRKSETHREFGLDVVDNQHFVDFERDLNDYVFNKGIDCEQFNYNSRQEHVDRSCFGNERSMAVEEATKQSVCLWSENSFYPPKEGRFNINDQTKNTRPQFEQGNTRTDEKNLEYDPRDSRPPMGRRKPWNRRQAEVPPDRSRRGLSELSPGATPRDLPAVAGPRPSRRFIRSLGRETEEQLEGAPRSGAWSRHSRNQFRDKGRHSASPGSQQNLIKNNRRRQSPSVLDGTVETSSSANAEESLQTRKRRRSLSVERDWNRGSYTNDLKRHETIATRRSLVHSPSKQHVAPSTGRETRRNSPKERASLSSGRTPSACVSKGIEGDGNSKRLKKSSPRRSENDLRNLLILRKQARQASVGRGMAPNNKNKRESKPSLIGKGSKSPLTSPCSQSSPESRSTARGLNRKRYNGTDNKTKHKAEIGKKPRRELNAHVSQDASPCSSMASKEGRNNKLLKDSDESAVSDGYRRKEKPPGSRRNLSKELHKAINSPNKLKTNNGPKADTKRTNRLLSDLAPVCLSEVNVPLGGPESNGSNSKQAPLLSAVESATPNTCQRPLTKAVLHSAFEEPLSNEIYGQERNSIVGVADECLESLQAGNRPHKETLEGWRIMAEASQTDAGFPENRFGASYGVGIPGRNELNFARKYHPPITVNDYTPQQRKEESFYHDIQTCESYLDGERMDGLVPMKKIADFCIESCNTCHHQGGNCTSTCTDRTALHVGAAANNAATHNSLPVVEESTCTGFCENASFLVNDCFSERASNPGPFCPKDVNKNAWERDALSQNSANCQQMDMEISSNEEFPIRNLSDIRTTTPFTGKLGPTDKGLTHGVNDSEGTVRRELTINSSRNTMDDCQEVDMELSSDEATHNPSPRIMETDTTFDLSKTGNFVLNFEVTGNMQTVRGSNMVSGVLQTEEHYQKTEGTKGIVTVNRKEEGQEGDGQIWTTQQRVYNTDSANFDTENRKQELHHARDVGFNHNSPKEEAHSVEYPVCREAFDTDGFDTNTQYQEDYNNKEGGTNERSEEGVYCGERDNPEKELYSTEGTPVDESNTNPGVCRTANSGMDVGVPDQEPYITEGTGLDVHVPRQEVFITEGSGCDIKNMKRERYSNENAECVYNGGNCKEVHGMKDAGETRCGFQNTTSKLYLNEKVSDPLQSPELTNADLCPFIGEAFNVETDATAVEPASYVLDNSHNVDGKSSSWDVRNNRDVPTSIDSAICYTDKNSEYRCPVKANWVPSDKQGKDEEYRASSPKRSKWKRGEHCPLAIINRVLSGNEQQEAIEDWTPYSPTTWESEEHQSPVRHDSVPPAKHEDSGNCSPYSPSSATCKDRLDSPTDISKPNQREKSKDYNLFPTICSKRKGDKNHFFAENDTSVPDPPEHKDDCNNYTPNRSLCEGENYLLHSKASDDDLLAVPQRNSSRRLSESKRENIAKRDWDGDLKSYGFPRQADVEISSDNRKISDTLETESEHPHPKEQLIGCTKENSSVNESFSMKNAKTSESIGDVNLTNSINNCDDKAENKRDDSLGTQDADCTLCDSDNTKQLEKQSKQSLKNHSNTLCSPPSGPRPVAESYHSSNENGIGHKHQILYATNDGAAKPDHCVSFDKTPSGGQNRGLIYQGLSEDPSAKSEGSRMQTEPHSTTITYKGTRDGDNCQLVNEPLSNSIIDAGFAKVVEETVKNVRGTKSCSVKNDNAHAGDRHLQNNILERRPSDGISFSLTEESPIQPPVSRTTDVSKTCYHEDTLTSPKAGVDSSKSTLQAMNIDPRTAAACASSDDSVHQTSKCHGRTNDGKTQSDSQITFKDFNKDKSTCIGDSLNNLASSLMDCCPSFRTNNMAQRNAPSFHRGMSCQEIDTASEGKSPDNTTLLKDSTDPMAPDYRVTNRLSACPNSSSIAGDIIKPLKNTHHNADATGVEPSGECKMDSSDSSVSSSKRNLFLGDDASEKVGSAKKRGSFARLIESPHTVTGNEPLTAGQERRGTGVHGGSENKVQSTRSLSVHIQEISRPKTAESESASDSTSRCATKRTLPVLYVGSAARKNMKLKLASVKESDFSAKTTVDPDTCERPPVSATASCTDNRLTTRIWNPSDNSSTTGSRATLPSKGSNRQEKSSKVASHAGNLLTMSSAPALVCETNTKSQPEGRGHSARAPPSLSMAPHRSDTKECEHSARAPPSLSMTLRVSGIEAKSCSALNKIDTRATENTSKDGSKDSTSCTRTKNELTALKMERLRKKKEEIEKVYRRECRTVINVVKLLVSNDPRLESLLQNAVRRSLLEMGRRCVQELEKHVRLGT